MIPSLPTASRCFGGTPQRVPALAPFTLSDGDASALGALLPLLGCGEEAAALAFDAFAGASSSAVDAAALAAIAAEERGHDGLIAALIAALPADPHAAATRRKARRFHIELGRGAASERLARIAATDAAVCTILSRLLAPGRPLARDQVVHGALSRIHRDEARHVRLSRRLAGAHGGVPALRDIGAAARGALADVLRLGGAAFEQLGVDSGRLDRDLRRLPDGLFTA